MKQITVLVTSIAILVCGFAAGAMYGRNDTHENLHFTLEDGAAQQLALLLSALDEMENGNLSKARWMIQSGTVGQFETFIHFADFEDKNRNAFRCVLLNQYRDYYIEKKLFKTKDWASFLDVSGMKEAINKRDRFFSEQLPVLCPHSTK